LVDSLRFGGKLLLACRAKQAAGLICCYLVWSMADGSNTVAELRGCATYVQGPAMNLDIGGSRRPSFLRLKKPAALPWISDQSAWVDTVNSGILPFE
jgi:hypothetical protein